VARGGTFNPASHVRDETKTLDIKTHFTLPYEHLDILNAYDNVENNTFGTRLTSLKEQISNRDRETLGAHIEFEIGKREEGSKIVQNIGNVSELGVSPKIGGTKENLEVLGVIRGHTKSSNVDKRNILPVLHGETKPSILNSTEEETSPYKDFIKFMFRDVVNNKWLVFRSILSGMQDSVSPNYNEHQYIGRPDTLYTYSGVKREIGFTMKTYPKTKQELPMLMEKMNYLVGLCYPSFTETERMVAPFVELTIGDMFSNMTGLLGSVSVTVEDATTWEIDEGLQFPHYISTAITFKHIGKHLPVTTGKHYDLPWIDGDKRNGVKPMGSWATDTMVYPSRTAEYGAYDNLNLEASTATEQADTNG